MNIHIPTATRLLRWFWRNLGLICAVWALVPCALLALLVADWALFWANITIVGWAGLAWTQERQLRRLGEIQ